MLSPVPAATAAPPGVRAMIPAGAASRGSLRRGPQVVPQQRGPDDLAAGVQHDHAAGCAAIPIASARSSSPCPALASARHRRAG